jgi:integrase
MPYKERSGWRAVITEQGKRSTKWFQTKREAHEWESAERKAIKNQKPKTITGLLSLFGEYLDYAERYSKYTYSHKKTLCRRLLSAWGDIDIYKITPKMCLSYLDSRSRISGNAANEDLKEMRSIFSHFKKFNNIEHNPLINIAHYSHEVKPPYVPPREDITKLLMVTQGQDRIMLDVFRFTAARRSEVLKLTWDDILFDQRSIRLTTNKSRKGKVKAYYVPMSETLYKSLQWQWNNRDKSSPYVFTHKGDKYSKRDEWLPKLCKKAGVKPFGYHSFRRAFATGIMSTGKASLKDVSMLLGHGSVRHTELYLRSINLNLPGLVELLENNENTPEENTKSRN